MLKPMPPPLPIVARSFISVVSAPRQPSFTAPTRFESGHAHVAEEDLVEVLARR